MCCYTNMSWILHNTYKQAKRMRHIVIDDIKSFLLLGGTVNWSITCLASTRPCIETSVPPKNPYMCNNILLLIGYINEYFFYINYKYVIKFGRAVWFNMLHLFFWLKFIFLNLFKIFLLLCWVGVYCSICKSFYNISNI
jgi:hypothetical protein